MMVRFGTSQMIFIVMMLFAENCIRLAECDEDKKIIIYVPRRVKTIHHHHHHVVLMDPKKKTMTAAVPYSEKSSSDEDEHNSLDQARQTLARARQQQFAHYHEHLRHTQQRRQLLQKSAHLRPPMPFDRRRKSFPIGPLPLTPGRLPPPNREVIARVYKYNDDY
ncbi:Hypothetical protein CINCED_3A006010 [Cinara cedri]|uniref:Uncharacterized protein n=1 Tax=Cinara cedri TaxID=506608 RepID=A0A5E4M5U2_9HEMI|nr:Hypothetical protein CINCED_3A006010 [Cinara cedri]